MIFFKKNHLEPHFFYAARRARQLICYPVSSLKGVKSAKKPAIITNSRCWATRRPAKRISDFSLAEFPGSRMDTAFLEP